MLLLERTQGWQNDRLVQEYPVFMDLFSVILLQTAYKEYFTCIKSGLYK